MGLKFAVSGMLCLLALAAPAAPQGTFDWSEGRELFPGIRHFALTTAGARYLAVQAVQVDTRQPDLRFYTTPADPAKGEPMPEFPQYTIATRRQQPRQYLRQARRPAAEDNGYGLDMVLAVNASPWVPWEKPFNHKYAADLGLVIAQGDVVSDIKGASTVFAIRRDGTPDIRVVTPEDDNSDLYIAVGGFGQILHDGAVSGDETLHPRTVFGISEDKRYVYFVTIDGRQEAFSDGIGTREAAEWLKFFGAWNGINMDGGGSTQMAVYVPADDSVRLLNHPPDNVERSVANSIGVYYEAPQP